MLKEDIKKWRREKEEDQQREKEELKRKVVALDVIGEALYLDEEMVQQRWNYIQKLKEIEDIRFKDLRQKAKSKWNLEGDENTAYFHGIVNMRKSHSRINGVNANGRWIHDPDDVKNEVFDFFQNKFKEEGGRRPGFRSDKFKSISVEERLKLQQPFTREELKEAVWSCGKDKAPGPDGFTFDFIKKFWHVVGEDFYLALKDFEKFGVINPGSTASFIALIPKCNDPISLSDYRPINLIGCISKVISKTLANRLKDVLPFLVGQEQSAFVKKRSILDCPLMVNEAISLTKKRKKKLMIFKVDFAKAFDTLNWNYLEEIIKQMGFGDIWLKWIRGCLINTRVSVLVNGSPTLQFCMERGVRQGDPIAPFLFILATEGLRVAIEEAVENNIFRGFAFPNQGPNISILQFADDTLFLGEWEKSNIQNLLRILKCFHAASGLQINIEKCSLMGVGVENREVSDLARILKCNKGAIPFTYLGMPVGANMTRKSSWDPLVNKFRSKLSLWKAKCLSFGGRLTLCKSVLGSLGTYLFSLYKAPIEVLKKLESLRMSFFWGGNEEKRNISWVSWKKVLNEGKKGGLNVGSLNASNLSLMGKWWWRYKKEPQALWRKAITSIHGEDGNLGGNSYSGCWGRISSLNRHLQMGNIDLRSLFFDEDGTWQWGLEDDGIFTVKSLRHAIDNYTLEENGGPTPWFKKGPKKANILLWRATCDRQPEN